MTTTWTATFVRGRRWFDRWLAHAGHASYDGLERLFLRRVDPWGFQGSPYEQARFAKMLNMAQSVPHQRILEVGCAEGHCTARLLAIAADVTAIDLSAEAIARARQRAPMAHFVHARLEDLPPPAEPYDLVVCGEMLYYVEDLESFIEKLHGTGRYLLTSTCYPAALSIDRRLTGCAPLRRAVHIRIRELRAASIRLWKL